MKKPFVISISSISGGGKTTVTNKLKERLPNSAVIFFDEYGNSVYLDRDINEWSADTNDYNEWHVEPVVADIERLLGEPLDYIILDFPFGNLNECVGQCINLAVFVDTPLDVALARRIIRNYTSRSQDSEFGLSDVEEVSLTALDKELRFYLACSRSTYVRMREMQEPNSDLIVDGTKSPAEITDEILIHINKHNHYDAPIDGSPIKNATESDMDFGIPTLIELKSLEDCAALCKELGFQFLELNMNLPEYQTDRLDAEAFAKIAKRYGIYYTVHLDENLSPCDFNEKVSNAYIETVLQTIELAKQLRIPVLNMHLSNGVFFTLPEKKLYLFDEYMDVYLSKLTDFRDRCEKTIGGVDIKICLENTNGYNKDFMQKGLALLLESKAFALTFDIGHNVGIGGGDEEVIMKNKNKLCHMHMHDAKGKSCHLPLGTGELDLPKYFYLAKTQNCRVVLETKTVEGLKESVEWIKNRKPATL